jgi:hypothetical protein
MNDRFFSMGIMLLFITIGVNTMLTMGAQLQDTQGTPLSVHLLPYIAPLYSVNDIRTKTQTCSVNANQLTPQSTTPGSTEGFTPITCKETGGLDLAAGIGFIVNSILMLAGLELMLVAIGTYLIPIAYYFFIGLATIVALLKWGLIAYAGSQIVRALFGRSLF